MSTSLHVLTFSSKGHLLLNESEGSFDLDTWNMVFEVAKSICRHSHRFLEGNDGDVDMADNGGLPLENFVREVVEDKMRHDHAWKLAET